MTTVAPVPRHDLLHPDGRAFHIYGELRGTLAGRPAHVDLGGVHLRYDALTDTWVVVSPAREHATGRRRRRGRGRERVPALPGRH